MNTKLNPKKITFPNNFECYYVGSKEETEYIFKEVFIEQQYLQNGIVIREGDCIFDVGANIGMFSLFVNQLQEKVKIYAFEPIEKIFDVLNENVRLHYLEKNVFLFNYGLSSENNHEQIFTFYPQMTGNSTSKPGEKLVNIDAVFDKVSNDVEDLFTDFFKDVEQVKCQVRTLSSVIKELGINSIDLLKIDVEGEEYEVFKGIESSDWAKIKQIVAEVHDRQGKLDRIKEMLTFYGFSQIKAEKINFLPSKFVDTYNLYAVR
ncbi:methyltransferase [Nostoc calcicola FACHB-389]|nr:FkbM family methyltransferase [Nostoc sp. EkiNYC01]OKH38553.1 methyltransferase [Nostoc calcicola FACHB-389]